MRVRLYCLAWFFSVCFTGVRPALGNSPYSRVLRSTLLMNCRLLFSSELKVSNINWLKQPNKKNITAKIRYRQEDQACEIHQVEGNLYVNFKNPQRAVTPGQFIVFYEDEICLGGGEIDI